MDFLLSVSFNQPYSGNLGTLDFERLYRLAQWHGLRPQLLAFAEKYLITLPFITELVEGCRELSFYNLILANELTQLKEMLAQNDIECYAYKGSFWAEWLYQNIGMREFGDIDILVADRDILKSLEVLREEGGYIPDHYRQYLLNDKASYPRFMRTDYHIPLLKDYGNQALVLELHWRTAYPRLAFDFPAREWAEYGSISLIRNKEVNGFINEYQLLLLIVHHSGKESWHKLKYIADLCAYMNLYGASTDWRLVYRLARKKGIFQLVQDSFNLLIELGYEFNFSLPEVLRLEETGEAGKIISIWEEMPAASSNSTLPYLMRGIAARDGWKFKCKVIWSHLSYFLEIPLLLRKAGYYRKNR